MDRIELRILYRDDGVSKLRCIVNKWKFQDSMMGEQYLTFTITSEKPIDWNIGDFCQFRGETYTLNYVPSVTQKAGTKEKQDAYTYENVKFESYQEELTRCLMLDITPTTGDYVAALGTNYTGSSKFPLFCGEVSANGRTLTAVCALAAKMQANLDRMYPENGWKIFVDTTSTYVTGSGAVVLVTHTEDKALSFDNTSVSQALAEVHNTFNLDYCIRGRNIYIGYNLKNLTSDKAEETFAFGYGKGYASRENQNKALFQIKRVANSQQMVVTRLRALGSTKNMPYRFYNKKYNLSQSLFPTNLQLPDTFATPAVKAQHNAQRDQSLCHVKGDTNDAYIDKNNDAASCKEGIRETSVSFDGSNADLPEIYPTIEEATYGELRGALVQDQDGVSGYGSFPGYGDSERINKLLAVGYIDNNTLVNDANKDNGILPESGIASTGIVRAATIGMTYLNFNTKNNGDFSYTGSSYRGDEKTLFRIQGVAPGSYAMAPTTGAVIFGFSMSCYRDGCSCDVGYIITVKARNVKTDITTTIATYNSDFLNITRNEGIKEIELPELPDVKEESPKVQQIRVNALSDITVEFTPVIRNVSVPSGFTDNFSVNYQVANSRIENTVKSAPEYTWFPISESDTLTDTFHVFVQDMGFEFEACWSDETPMMVMKSGRCVGREFEIGSDVEKVEYGGKKGYMLTLKRAQDSSLNTYYPSQTDPIAAGDQFVLLGIQMPDAYVQMAEVRLLRAATDYLADNCETKFTYQPSIDDIYLQRNLDLMRKANRESDSIFWRLYAGLKFTFRGIPSNETDPLPLAEITIEKVTISMGEGLTPKVELTLNDDVQQGTIQKLTTSVDRIYNGSIFSGGSGNGAVSAAILSILQSEGDKLFLSKTHEDTAAGKITFEDTVTFEESARARKGIVVGRFQSGLLGNGALIDEEGNAEFNSIFSRNFISTPEFRFNRVNVTEGEDWCTNGFGTILNVEIIDDTTGYIDLKLEENDYTSIQVGDICRGIYNDILQQYETKELDDDSELYDDGDTSTETTGTASEQSFGFSSKSGFFTSYFWVKQFVTNKKGECRFLYELRNEKTPHPCEFMKFAQYGSFTNSERRSSSYSTSIGHYYEMVLDGVADWKIVSANVVYRKGYLGNMFVTLKNGKEAQLQGYGLYVQDNVYFGNAVVQLDPETLEDIGERLKSYTIDFSEYVNVITVDDVGNVIGGLYTISGSGSSQYRQYRIQTAISVRKNDTPLIIAEDDENAGEGTYKIYVQPKGCTCVLEDSTIYITSIDNIKDGVAGSSDDTNFDYDAMREMSACSVDIVIDCEGKSSIQKSLPIRIKHDSAPYVGADISNEFSAVSWNTKTQRYIGLPITFEMKMWHNNEPLDIASVNDIAVTPTISGMTVSKSIATKSNGVKVAVVKITALPTDLPLVTDLNVTCVATYSGVPYERTLVHTINKTTDTNVYSLLPSVSEIVIDKNKNTLSENSITCKVVCDSSDDKHYEVAFTDFATHKLAIYYRKFNTDGTSDSAETLYDNTAIPVSSSMSEIRFYLYGLKNGTVDKTIVHDMEGVAVIADGLDGKGVEYIFITKNDWDGTDANKPTIYDVASDRQVDNYCPYTDAQHTDQWTDEPTGIGINRRYEFYAQRKKVNGVWQPFGSVKLWDRYALDGQSPYTIDLTNEQSFVNCDENGNVISGYETSGLMLFKGNSYAFTDFNILITPTNIKCNGNSSAFSLTDAQKTSAQSSGSITLTPSALTANSGTISIQATQKTNSSIVLVAVYKVNKNLAGKNSVIYSIIPSLNVIHKDNLGTFVDASLGVTVKKTVGATATILETYAAIAAEGLSIDYQNIAGTTTLVGSGTSSGSAVSVSSSVFVGGTSGTYGVLRLKQSGTIIDTERINVVTDGDDGVAYYLRSDINSIVKDYAGNFKGSARPTITAWKKVGANDAVRLADIVDESGVVAEGMTIKAYEMNGSTVVYTKTSTTGVLTCSTPFNNVDRFEVELVKGSKTYATLSIPILQEVKGETGLTGCHERLFEVFTAGQTYYNEENTVKSGIRYVDFMAIEDNTYQSGYRVYMCNETHVAASSFNDDSSYWSEVNINAASAFFTYLIAKNANIKILTSAQFTIAEANGTIVAGLANKEVPLWVGSSNPSRAPFRVTRAGKLYATDAEISGTITATSGLIGGFKISGKGLTNVNDDGTFTNDAYIILRNDDHRSFVGIGPNVLPAYSTARATARFEIEDTANWFGYGKNIAVVMRAKNADYNYAFVGEGNGLLNGAVDGFKLNVFTPTSDVTAIPIEEGNRVLVKNSSTKSVYLPTLAKCRTYLDVNNSTYFALEMIIMAASGASDMTVFGYRNGQYNDSDCPHIRWNDEYQDAIDGITIGEGDILHLILVYDGSFNAFIISHRV